MQFNHYTPEEMRERQTAESNKYFDFERYTRDQTLEVCHDPALAQRIIEAVFGEYPLKHAPKLYPGEDGLDTQLSEVAAKKLRKCLIGFWGDIYSDGPDVLQCADISEPIVRACLVFWVQGISEPVQGASR